MERRKREKNERYQKYKIWIGLKVLTHEFLVGVGARLAPACSRFS